MLLLPGQVCFYFLCSYTITSAFASFVPLRNEVIINNGNFVNSPTFLSTHSVFGLSFPSKLFLRRTNLSLGNFADESAETFYHKSTNDTNANASLKLDSTIRDANGEVFNTSGPIFEKELNYVGAGTLGDIMSDPNEENSNQKSQQSELLLDLSNQTISKVIFANKDPARKSPIKSGLVTTAGGNLQSQFKDKVKDPPLSPLERIALTANGSLQRIFSSYYDAPVHVHVDRCEVRMQYIKASLNDSVTASKMLHAVVDTDPTNDKNITKTVWDRTVHLSVHDQTFCTATSTIIVHCPLCEQLVESGEVGIGQLFRYLDKLPTFELLDAGRNRDGGLWRHYILECEEVTCDIREDFRKNAWTILPPNDYFPENEQCNE